MTNNTNAVKNILIRCFEEMISGEQVQLIGSYRLRIYRLMPFTSLPSCIWYLIASFRVLVMLLLQSMLFTLPQHLLSVLFLEWIDVIDIAHLDSACCSGSSRDVFLDVLKSPQSVLRTDNSLFYQSLHVTIWGILRSLKLICVSIRCCDEVPYNNDSISKYLLLCGSRLQEVMIIVDNKHITKLISLLEEIILHTPGLESLKIKTSHLPDAALHLLTKLTQLRNLHIIDGRPTTASSEEELKQSPDDPSSSQVAVHTLSEVTPWPLLRSIVLADWLKQRSNLSDSLFYSLLHMGTSITHLTLSWVEGFDFGLIATHCPNLLSLTLQNTDIGARNLIKVSEKCPHITSLHLICYWCGGDHAAFKVLFQNLKLHTLSINLSDFNDTTISYIGKYLHTTLTTFLMCGVAGHSDISIYWDVFRQCTLLHTLAINGSDLLDLYISRENNDTLDTITTLVLRVTLEHIHDSAIGCIHELCPNLHTLHVYCEKSIVMNELTDTVKSCTQLRTLYVQKISDSVVRAIRKINPHLLVYTVKEPDWFTFTV